MRKVPALVGGRSLDSSRIITPASQEFGVSAMVRMVAALNTGGAWASANDPLALPFCVQDDGMLVDRLGWLNGGSAGGNVDVGVYDTSWNRLVSTGSTGGSGSGAWQWVNVTDTYLRGGRYYLVCSRDNTTGSRVTYYNHGSSATLLAMCGLQSSSTDAFPLPDPLTNMGAAATFAQVPVLGIGTRAPF